MVVEIVPVTPQWDADIAKVIRQVLIEYGANGAGFAWEDPELDELSKAYADDNALYLVIIQDGQIVGGGGISPLASGDNDVCELQKMYLLPSARGAGLGKRLLTALLDFARSHDYRQCYLETLASMSAANHLYNKMGFKKLSSPLGCTGHGGCDTWYALPL
jgi:putative acetyltransferase